MPEHLARLPTILSCWTRAVTSGEWVVGPDGVEGGVELWKQADTPEFYNACRLDACFDEG